MRDDAGEVGHVFKVTDKVASDHTARANFPKILVQAPGVEPGSTASETATLSIVLRLRLVNRRDAANPSSSVQRKACALGILTRGAISP